MTYYIPANYGKIAHRLGLTGDPDDMFVTLAWFDATGTADLNSVASGLHAAFKTFWTAKGSDQYTLKGTSITRSTGPSTPPELGEHIESSAGGSSSNPIPQNTAYMVRKSTGLGGVYNKGRMYIPGALESLVSPTGVIDSTYLTGYNTALATLLSSYEAVTDVDQIVLLHNPRPGSATPTPTQIVSLTLDPVVSTQRRRLRK